MDGIDLERDAVAKNRFNKTCGIEGLTAHPSVYSSLSDVLSLNFTFKYNWSQFGIVSVKAPLENAASADGIGVMVYHVKADALPKIMDGNAVVRYPPVTTEPLAFLSQTLSDVEKKYIPACDTLQRPWTLGQLGRVRPLGQREQHLQAHRQR